MRYSTKTRLLSGSALVASGFLASAAIAQDVTIAFPADELGSTSYNPVTSSNLNTAAS